MANLDFAGPLLSEGGTWRFPPSQPLRLDSGAQLENLEIAYRTGGSIAISDGAFDGEIVNPRVITAREDGTVSVWPVDPLPAARLRKPRELIPLERDRERRLALPLRFE